MTEINKFLGGAKKLSKINLPIDIQDGDGEQRIVVGFASLNNVDQTDDMITEDANMQAFENFRGNIRFMHKDRPVGKMVDYQPAVYFDQETGREYRGVQVAVAISKAAEDVWAMCLDGTVSGFSIGGSIRKATTEYNEELNKTIRVIHEYQLTELSLVDSPANQLANVQTIYKSIDGVPSNDSVQVFGSIEKVLEIKTEGDSPQVADKEDVSPAEVNEVSEQVDTEVENSVEATEAEAESKGEAEAEVEDTTADIEAEDKPSINVDELMEMLRVRFDEQAEAVSTVSESMTKNFKDELEGIRNEFQERFEKIESDAEKKLEIQETLENINKRVGELEEGIVETQKKLDSFNDSGAFQKALTRNKVTNLEPSEDNPFAGVFSNRYE